MQRKAERLARRGAELVPGPGRDGDQVERFHVPYLIGEQALPSATQDHDGVDVLMPFQGGIAARRYLEVAEVTPQRGMREQFLTGDRPERCRAILLVGAQLHAIPAEVVLVGAQSGTILVFHRRVQVSL